MPDMAEERGERLSAVRGFPSKTSHRLSAMSGVVGVVLAVAAFLLDLDRPHFDDTPAKYASYYTNNQSKLQIALLLFMFSTFGLAWYLGFLRWLYEGAERGARGFVRAAPIAFAGGITGLAVAAATGVGQLAAIELGGSIDDSMVRALDLFSAWGAVWAAVLLSVFLLSSFFIIRVTEVLPEWLGIVAVVAAILGFFQAALVLSPGQDDGIFGLAGVLWFALFLVYVLFSSIILARRVETALLAG
ncbi:MAG: hypothetical protein QOJ29_1275 [Thermoleophilaceae bacterium]|jgi:hypothetical protein|nr:hypothetical protein [Thermoleophilaceae bacterium]